MLVVRRMRNGGSCSRRRRHDSDWIAAIVSDELKAECSIADGGAGNGKREVELCDVTWGSDQTQTQPHFQSQAGQVGEPEAETLDLVLDGLGGTWLGEGGWILDVWLLLKSL